MKKVFLSTAAIAVAFMAFAFNPAEKNNSMDNVQVLSEMDLEKAAGFCDTKWRTQADFSECDRTTTPPDAIDAQSDILGDY